jgi:hypothetical protein
MPGIYLDRLKRVEGHVLHSLQERLRKNREIAFAIETVKKLFVFAVIALSAVIIHWIVEVLDTHQVSSPFISGILLFVEHAMLLIDAVWIILFFVLEAARAITEQMDTLALKIVAAATLLVLGAAAHPYLKMWLAELGDLMMRHML